MCAMSLEFCLTSSDPSCFRYLKNTGVSFIGIGLHLIELLAKEDTWESLTIQIIALKVVLYKLMARPHC